MITLYALSLAKQQHVLHSDFARIRCSGRGVGTPVYPAHFLDERCTDTRAKEHHSGLRRKTAARAEDDVIRQRRGSRKGGLPPSSRCARSPAAGPAVTSRRPDLFESMSGEGCE